jgi:hypothetical protein
MDDDDDDDDVCGMGHTEPSGCKLPFILFTKGISQNEVCL